MIEVRVPKVGMSTIEVDVLEILVKVGDSVAPGTPLAEIEAEKATFVVEAEHNGVVREVLLAPGAEASVGDVILRIEPPLRDR